MNPETFDNTDEYLDALALELVLEVRSEDQILDAHIASDRPKLRALFADPQFHERVHDLRDWVGETREQLEPWTRSTDPQAAKVSAEILNNTTRAAGGRILVMPRARLDSAPMGLLGDAKVMAGFVRRRLASSVALRLAAASLVAHMIALPALAAYIYWGEASTPELVLRFDPDQQPIVDESPELAPEEPLVDDRDLWSALGLQEANILAEARYGLSHLNHARWQNGVKEPAAFWVQTRLMRLQSGTELSAVSGPVPAGAHPLAQILALEMAMDDWVLGRRKSAPSTDWTGPVEAFYLSQEGDQAWLDLAAQSLARAQSFGLPLGSKQIGDLPPFDHAAPMGPSWEAALGSTKPGPDSSPSPVHDWFQEQR